MRLAKCGSPGAISRISRIATISPIAIRNSRWRRWYRHRLRPPRKRRTERQRRMTSAMAADAIMAVSANASHKGRVAMLFEFPLSSNPEMLALTILVSTFFLEDVAIGYAGVLSATGVIAPPLAFVALFLGVYMGDLGLYFLGAGARHHKRLQRFIGEGRIQQAGKWLKRRSVIT